MINDHSSRACMLYGFVLTVFIAAILPLHTPYVRKRRGQHPICPSEAVNYPRCNDCSPLSFALCKLSDALVPCIEDTVYRKYSCEGYTAPSQAETGRFPVHFRLLYRSL